MPKLEQKQTLVSEIRGKINRAQSVVLVDARGLTVEQDTSLRKTLREAGVEYKVYKNTMLNFAVEGTASEGLKPYLAGPTTVAFSYDDPTLAAGLLSKQAKTLQKLTFKAGVVGGVLYDADGMKAVAEIPSREVLLARLLGSFKSPMASFARVINAAAEKISEAAGA